MTSEEHPVDRGQALDMVREIYRLSRRVEASKDLDLQARAAEIGALAHYMLYDADGGLEDQT